MTNKTFLLSTIILMFQISSFGQQLNDSIFNVFKTKIESSDFPPFQGTKLKFNRTNYFVKTNMNKDTLIIERVKVVENGYSDPSNDKEIRSVAFRDIDYKMTSVEKGEDYFFFKIFTNGKQNLVNYKLMKGDQINTMTNNTIGIGRFSKKTEQDMQDLADTFAKIFN